MDNKFIETLEISDWEVETDSGWEDITHIYKTIPFDVWELCTENHTLKCADDHIVMVEGMVEKFVKDLTKDDLIITKNGLEKVISVKQLDNEPESMYDVTVDSKNHVLFTNGILSHNTTVTSIFLLWYVLFNKDKTAAVCAHKLDAAQDILKRIKTSITMLPLWLQQGLVDNGWNKRSVAFENGSRIIAAATSTESLTSFTINLLFLDEFAKIPDHVAEEFITSTYPVITAGKTSKIILVSTPKGMNLFYEFWSKAVRDNNKNNFYPIKVNWWENPERDEEWKERTIADIGPIRFSQEFQCSFLGGSSTIIDSDILERIKFKDPIATKWNGLFKIYEQPIQGVKYVLGVDTSEGIGKDYSVIQVIKINGPYDVVQVAVYRHNLIIPHDYTQVVISIANFYNTAPVMVENNGIGNSVCESMWHEFEYEELINLDAKGLGIRSTKKSKRRANELLKEYVEKGFLLLQDERTIYELSRYEEIKPNVYAAGKHDHDDAITSLLWALYYLVCDEFDDRDVSVKNIDDEFDIENDNNNWEYPTAFFDDDI